MKNLFLALAFILTCSFVFANDNEYFNAEITINENIQNGGSNYTLIFKNIEDFNAFDANQLQFDCFFCTTDISLTVSVGAGKTYASVTITAKDVPCDEVGSKIKDLRDQAKSALKKERTIEKK
ncbi:MAG: hypothetical protein LAT51_12415 [Flavobacteriaceae bacterium]|nr:hypothetical protein [Flavobacteriaceae bacterium]